MRELWSHSERIHTELAKIIESTYPKKRDIHFFLVGKEMIKNVAPPLENHFKIFSTDSSKVAGEKIAKLVNKEVKPTLIYVKWSQNTIFLEEGIKEFLENKDDDTLLCRQSEEWKKKKNDFFQKVK